MVRTLVVFAALSTAAMFGGDAAQAQINEHIYPWCAEYGGRDGGATNCGFSTLDQCRATISGIGGTCYANPAYPPATEGKGRRKVQPAPR